MFVVEGMRVAGNDSDVNRVCSIAGCDDDSMLNTVRDGQWSTVNGESMDGQYYSNGSWYNCYKCALCRRRPPPGSLP